MLQLEPTCLDANTLHVLCCKVSLGEHLSDAFPTQIVLKQGDALVPHTFQMCFRA
jgi:hypothetical protein